MGGGGIVFRYAALTPADRAYRKDSWVARWDALRPPYITVEWADLSFTRSLLGRYNARDMYMMENGE